jgi:hypothetical protein
MREHKRADLTVSILPQSDSTAASENHFDWQ